MKFFLLVIALGLCACGKQKITTEQGLKDYVVDPENGLVKQQQKNGVELEVIYRPAELVLAQQLQAVTTTEERIKTMKNFDSLSYFIIKLSRAGQEIENMYAGDPGKFQRVVDYLSFSLAPHVFIIHREDTITAYDAVYARSFGSATSTSVMTVFDTRLKEKSGVIRFCLDDAELDVGFNEFEFDLDNIKKAPTINLN
jgi:hypothetical protein